MKPIPFTQYLLPNGRTKEITIDRPGDIAELAEKFIQVGGRFAAEILMTGQIALYAEKEDKEEEPVAMEIIPNGPEVIEAVDKIIKKAGESI